ncbi:MAG TPA: hypothetical protein ENK46_00955 [Flavobacteriia bacterium]|nr:hypothetical protein [Flavobacteriia bacterium]
MRYLILFFILILFSCSSKPEKRKDDNLEIIELDDWICNNEKKEALNLLKNDSVYFVLINEFPRYQKQLRKLLIKSNLQLEIIGSMHGEGFCLKAFMDSVINVRFGINFRKEIEDRADSLFLELNKGSIFAEKQLDKRPILASDTSGQVEIIRRLNSKILNRDSVRLTSNIVNSPYFVVRFVVEKKGISRDAIIIERHTVEKFKNLEKLIINEINGLNGWSAGKIRNENVDSSIEVAIAIKKN